MFSFRGKLFEIERLGHERIGACLGNFLFMLVLAADGDDRSLIGGVGLDAPAYFNAVDTGNYDVQAQEIRLSSISAVIPSEAEETA